jgi:hypothetical protein
MIVRLLADAQNRLFWRGSGASALVGPLNAALPLWDGAKRPEMGSDVPAEQRLQGFDPLRCWGQGVLVVATSPSQQKGRCLVRTSGGSADGLQTGDRRPDLLKLQSESRSGHVSGMIKRLEPV